MPDPRTDDHGTDLGAGRPAEPGPGGQGSAGGGNGAGTVDGADKKTPESRAHGICLRLLAAAPRTRAQLADALERKGIDEPVRETVLGRFDDAGLIDDAAFAAAWVESRHNGRGLGPRVLAMELRRRGVDPDTVRTAVDDISADQEEETARGLVRRKLASTRRLDDATRVRRIMGMLARKGYSGGLAYRLVREELETEGSELDLPDPDLE